METRSKRRKTEPVVDKIRRGEISVVVALAEDLPDVFYSEILPKLDGRATLNLAQVSKWYNDAVWSVDGVRSMKEKMEAAKPDIPSEPLYWAARYGNMPAVRALLKSEEEAYNRVNTAGLTALHYAVNRGVVYIPHNLEIVRMLIEAGADINKLTNNGRTPLCFAATGGHPEATKILIDAGADLNISSPLREAIEGANSDGRPKYRRRCQACADLLIQAGANIPYVSDDDSDFDESYCSEVDFDGISQS